MAVVVALAGNYMKLQDLTDAEAEERSGSVQVGAPAAEVNNMECA